MTFQKTLYQCAIVCITTLLLTACGGATDSGGASLLPPGSSSGGSSGGSGGTSASTTVVTGSVGDGPVVNSQVSVYSRTGRLLANHTSDSNAHYNITLLAEDSDYPLSVKATGGLDIVSNTAPDFTLYSYVMQPAETHTANVNPFTTMIFETAKTLNGAVNTSNIQQAKQYVLEQMNFGFDTSRIPDPASTPINAGNIAGLLRASEAFGEMIRRVRNTLRTTDASQNGDNVIRAIAADLQDGIIDGHGARNTIPRASALTKIASAQVILEVMQGRLQVNGVDATASLDNASQVSLPNETVTQGVNEVPINEEIINQAKDVVAAVEAIDSDSSIDDTMDALEGISAGALPADLEDIIPDTAEDNMSSAMDTINNASDEEIDLVNDTTSQNPANQNNLPVISGTPISSVQVGSNYSFTPVANDVDGDTLSFTVNNLPSWLSFNAANGSVSGTPDENDIGTYSNIRISVFDGTATVSLQTFSITVTALPNNAPVISGTPITIITEGNFYSFTPDAFDADGDNLSFSITNRPSWASFNSTTGQLSGTPGNSNIGTHSNIRIRVSDGTDTTSLPDFSITVVAIPNTAPVISGTPSNTVQAGTAYTFTPSAFDADGNSLQFSISNKPVWAAFNAASGALTGTPQNSHVGNFSGIVISVSDGITTASLPSFTISVTAQPNNAPTISGTPATSVMQDGNYSFAPTANDADGDPLVFSITNKPTWATFNTSTGALSGTPGAQHVGITSNIRISVSDGTDTVSLENFSITVSPQVITFGTATLSWTPPTEKVDGSALNNLAGYKIYYGTISGQYTQTIDIDNPGLTSYVVENLPSGNTYYFAMTAYNSDGLESSHSEEGSKTIP